MKQHSPKSTSPGFLKSRCTATPVARISRMVRRCGQETMRTRPGVRPHVAPFLDGMRRPIPPGPKSLAGFTFPHSYFLKHFPQEKASQKISASYTVNVAVTRPLTSNHRKGGSRTLGSSISRGQAGNLASVATTEEIFLFSASERANPAKFVSHEYLPEGRPHLK